MTPYETVTNDVGWTEMPRGVLRAEGNDARRWLHKIVTANVEQLETGQGAHSALLDAKGHFVSEFILLRDGDIYGLLCDSSARETLYQTLKRYLFREKVTFSDVSERWQCFVLVGEQAPALVERILETRAPETLNAWSWGRAGDAAVRVIRTARARMPSFDVMTPVGAVPDLRTALQTVPQVSDELLDLLRIEAGLPKWGVDFDQTTLALEIPDVMQIRVDQGCYVGQEVVSRIVHRGHVNRHLYGLLVESNAALVRGAPILFQGQDVGNITSAARSSSLGTIALGYVRRQVEPGMTVLVNSLTARIVELPFQN
jgi:tRNA-modifying protein YgfZ